MLFILSLFLLIPTVLLSVALLRLPRPLDILLAWALAAYASVVLVFQAANLLLRINDSTLILAFQGVLLLASAGIWLRAGRPALFPFFTLPFDLHSLLVDRRNGPLLLLGAVLAGALALYILLIYVVPPNNNDALSLHLARVLMWKQTGSYFPWDTPKIWQLTFPVDAQLVYLWTILLTGGDHFVAYVPFLAGLVTALLVYLLAREIGFERRWSLLAGLAWLSLPVVQLHLTSVRHDLISAWLFLNAVYLFYCWSQSGNKVNMALSALSLGLVVGTNFSIAAYLPGLAVAAGLLLLWRGLTPRQLLQWGGASLLAFLIFSSPIFISNVVHFGSPMGPDAAEMTGGAAAQEVGLGRYLAINVTRWSYQFVDFSGLPQPIVRAGTGAKAAAAEGISRLLSLHWEGDLATMDQHVFSWKTIYPLQEDAAWYGLLGFLLIFPTSIWAFIYGIRRCSFFLALPVIFLVTSLVTATLIRPGWTPYDGRYFLPLSAMSLALLPLWLRGQKLRIFSLAVILLLSLSSILMVVGFNPAKQIVGGAAIWKMNRIDRMTRQSYGTKEMIYLADANLPEKAVVGIASQSNDYQEYGVFGEHFTRTVIPVNPPENVGDAQWLRDRGIQYLLIQVTKTYPVQIPSSFHYMDSLGDWVVYRNQASN